MMRSLLFLLLLRPLMAAAQPPAGYYDATIGLSGPTLREALYEIINGHTVLPNSELWAAFEITDQRPDGTVWDIYSDVPGAEPPYVFNFVEDQCGTYNSEGDCFNREHSFPQSWFDGSAPISTDLFHIYPTDAWVNQQRGNLPYGTVPAPAWTSANGSKRGECGWPGHTGVVFEPIDEYKGDLARGYFYLLTRYLPQLGTWDTPMMSNGDLSDWAESLLLAWHQQDPVSVKEVDRNNAIFGMQGNRNPFIDQPQWAASIWGPSAGIAEATTMRFTVTATAEGLIIHGVAGDPVVEQVMILDPAGRLVLLKEQVKAGQLLPIDLAPGIYSVAGISDGGRLFTRVIR